MPDYTLTPVSGDPFAGPVSDVHPSVATPLTISMGAPAPQQAPSQVSVDQTALSGDAFAYDQAPDQGAALASNARALGQAAMAVPAGAVRGAYDAVTYPRQVMQGQVDPRSDEGIGRTLGMAGLMAAPGLPLAEEGAAGAMGGRLFVSHGGERSFVDKAQARALAAAYDRQAVGLKATGADPSAIADIEARAASVRSALPQFDALPPVEGGPSGRFTPAKIMPSGDRAVAVATDPRHAPYDDARTYRVYQQPEGGIDGVTRARDLGTPLGRADMKQREDGRWEVNMVEVNPAARGQGVARDLYAAMENDLGQKMQPSGVLLPDGYAMWQRRDPTAVQYHQPVQASDGNLYHMSPRYLQEHAGGWAITDPSFDAAMRSAYDRVPAEGKTPEAIQAMFSAGLPLPGAAPALPATMGPMPAGVTPELFGQLLREGRAT